METISLSMLVSAVSAALVTGAKDVTESAVKDAYSAVKSKIVELFGAESQPSKAVQQFEENVDKEAYKAVMETELKEHNVLANDAFQQLASELIQALKQSETGKVQYAKFLNQGETNVGAQGDSNTFYGEVIGKKS